MIVPLRIAKALVTAALMLFFSIGVGCQYLTFQLTRAQKKFSAIIEARS